MRKQGKKKITVQDAFQVWFEEYVNINTRINTQKSYRGMIEKHIFPRLGNMEMRKLDARILQRFINERRKCLKRSSLGKLLAIMRSCFSYAVNPCGFCRSNPAENVWLPRDIEEPGRKVHVFSSEDVAAIEKQYPPGHDYYVALHICYYTGLRIGEALGLRWQDVNFENREVTVTGTMLENGLRQSMPKTRSSCRTIPYGTRLQLLLQTELLRQTSVRRSGGKSGYNEGDYVCCRIASGRHICAPDFRFFNAWCKKNLGGGSTHSLRHTHATMLLEAGETMDAVSKRLGHSSIAITAKYYSHVTEKGKLRMRATLDSLFQPDNASGQYGGADGFVVY